MSHRQTWLIRRDMVWGAALESSCWGHARAFRRVTRLFQTVRPTQHRRLASWLRARRGTARTGLPLCCQPRAPSARSSVVGGRCGGDAWGWSARYDSVAHNHENPFCKPKKLRAGRFSPIRASSARKSRTATWEASFIKTTTCAAALKPRAAVAQALNTASTRAAQHKHSSRRAHQSMPLLRSWSLWRSILPILAGPAFCLLTVEAFRGDGRGPKSPDRGEQGGGFGEARREEEA